MASKKINPAQLAQLAAIEAKKAGAQKPRETTPPETDWDTELFGTTTTTTTTVPSTPVTTATTVPAGQIPAPKGQKGTEPLSTTLNNKISSLEAQLFAKKTPAQVEKVKTGESKSQPIWKKALGLAINNPVTQTSIIQPLKTLAFLGRVGVSSFEESAQWARENLPGGKGTDRYEPGDYIPIHKQTGKPIAKAGDPIIRNWEDIISTPISDKEIEAANLSKTQEEQDKILADATLNVVNSNKRTAGGSWGEWARQIGTPMEFSDYGFGSISEVQIGRQLVEADKISPAVGKWIDRGIGLTGDIALDPTTYLSMGTTTAAKSQTRVLGEAADIIIDIAANDLANQGIKQVTKNAAVQVAELTGEKVTARTTQQTARAVVAEAAKVLKYKVATGEIVGRSGKAVNLDNLINESARRWSAIAPRREIGAGSRQATAAMVSDLRDEALQLIKTATADSAQYRAAKAFTEVVTDDVIKDIAVRGNAAIKGPVAQALSTPGGLRWGMGKFKVSIPGSQKLTEPLGFLSTLPRQGLATTKAGRAVINATTRIGEGGLFGSEYIYNWRTGLRSGYSASTGKKLTGKEAVDAIKRLSEDQTYRALKKTTSQTIKQGVDSVFRIPEFKKYFRTVHELLTSPTIDWNKTAEEIARDIARPLDEVKLAMRVRDLGTEFSTILDQLSASIPGGKIVALPENWFPETLNDKTVIWLNKNNPVVRDTLKALGLDSPPLAGQNIANGLVPGTMWFGHRLKEADILNGVGRLNYLANNPAGGVKAFVGEFFDTNVASAVEKWAKKFADDYAFLRNVARNDLEALGGGARGVASSALTSQAMSEIAHKDLVELANFITTGNLDDFNIIDKYAARLDIDRFDLKDIFLKIKKEVEDRLPILYEDVNDPDSLLSAAGFRTRFNQLLVEDRLDKLVKSGELRDAISVVSARETEILRKPKTPLNKTALESQESVISEIHNILNLIHDEMVLNKKTAAELFEDTEINLMDEISGYITLFAQNPKKFESIIDNIDPRMFKSMVNMTEDAFIRLDNKIVPDLYAQRQIAEMFHNVKRLKEPKFAESAARYIRNYNRFIKTWVTNTPGFHSRNVLSNVWQMVAGGGEFRNLEEARRLMSEWNRFVKKATGTVADIETIVDDILNLPAGISSTDARVGKIARTLGTRTDDVLNMKFIMDDVIARRGVPRNDWRFLSDFAGIKTRLEDPELLVDTFLTEGAGAGFSAAQQNAFRETMMWTGAAGFGDIEEVFGAAIPSRLGITGAEVPVRTSPIGKAASKVSETVGYIPRKSRSVGAKIENYSRFMFTYDGIRQGLTPEQAAARTARYLVDYEDLTQLDAFAKLIFPFWTWMSRNLPVQTANMAMNPKAYSIYNHFRHNFEDKEGNNVLLPDYLKDAGVFKAPFGKNIYIKPDLGFPGAGSPSPLQEGVTDFRSLLSAIPGYSLGSAITGTQAFSGAPLEGGYFGEKGQEILRQVLPPLGVAGRYISGIPGIGAGTDWGPLGPVQDVLGVKGPRESGAAAQQRRALASLLGIPVQNIGPDQENAARYEIIKRLQDELDAINRGQG